MQIQIVQANLKMLDECAEALSQSGIQTKYFNDSDYTLRLIKSGIDNNEVFVAIVPDEVVAGFYWATAKGMFCRFSYLRLLAVKPNYRNLHIGKELIGHFERNGFFIASRVFCTVSAFNTDAQRFYSNNGYVEVSKLADLYKPGVDEILMMKTKP